MEEQIPFLPQEFEDQIPFLSQEFIDSGFIYRLPNKDHPKYKKALEICKDGEYEIKLI